MMEENRSSEYEFRPRLHHGEASSNDQLDAPNVPLVLPPFAPLATLLLQQLLLLLQGQKQLYRDDDDSDLSFEQKETQVSLYSINNLPSEILLKIFGYLDLVTLNEIWKVCKRWKLLAQTKEIWHKSFSNEFSTQESFPSISGSKLWILEYEDRLLSKKRWTKSRVVSQYYKFMSERFVSIPSLKADFESKTLSGLLDNGEYGACKLINGKNFSYIPNVPLFTHKTPKYNQQYLIQIVADDDSIWIKKLQAAKSSGSSIKSSIRCQHDSNAESLCLDMSDSGSYQEFFVSGDVSGHVFCWNFRGELKNKYKVSEFPIIFVKSDFRNKIIAMDSNRNIYYINREEGKVLTTLVLDAEGNDEMRALGILDSNFNISRGIRWWVEVDFGFDKIILMYQSKILVVDYVESKLFKSLELPCSILDGYMQTVKQQKLSKFDINIAGSDGILYCNLLSDNSIFVWNIRDNRRGKAIIPQCHFKASTGRREEVSCAALNSLILILGYRSGFSDIHDVFTGELIRNCTKNFPKSFEHYYDGCPTHKILLNPDPLVPNGVVITYDLVQYFQFGELPGDGGKRKKGKLKKSIQQQRSNIRNIKVELEEYDRQEEEKMESQRLISKFNGEFLGDLTPEDDENELSLAIAVSQSESEVYKSLNDEEQLKLALELSMSVTNSREDFKERQDENDNSDEFSQQLAEALKLSLEENNRE